MSLSQRPTLSSQSQQLHSPLNRHRGLDGTDRGDQGMNNIEEDKSGEEVTEDVGDTLGENKGEEGRGGETTRSEEGNVDRTEGTAEGSEETVEVKAGNKPGKEGDAEEQITEESNGFKQEKADSALDSGGKEDSTKDGPEKSEEKGLEKDVDNTSKVGSFLLLITGVKS